jgi:catechol 2,3-dioxygenase-like lactoylglutathione lyase family enzyme
MTLMTTLAIPHIDCEHHVPTLAAADIRAAVDFYTTKLGFSLGFTWGDPPEFGGVNLDGVSVHLTKGTPNPKGCWISFLVGDADELYEFHRASGVEIVEPPGDRAWGLRDYTVRDLYGYMLRFGHPIYSTGSRLEIERVDVPVRLEKRLAALLRDLAEHKHMSVSSCLEETLLHTFEQMGDGVASPHTKTQLRYIQELKRKPASTTTRMRAIASSSRDHATRWRQVSWARVRLS